MRSHSAPDLEVLRTRVLAAIRTVPDFPSPGVQFMDIMPVLGNAELLKDVISGLVAPWWDARITHVAGIEGRGFILGAPMAIALGTGFIALRKPGKLPWHTQRQEYALEYGVGTLEVHADACPPAARVLVVDDVLATGGTARAACDLIQRVGGEVVGCSFLLQVTGLKGLERLDDIPAECLIP
ncbi:MAG: adenine phosphoribosyltransferase [Gemmatimonadota bacterium]|nr:adenine phosphoribosyltransferase [Gemmatimonadota bacterium]